MPKIEYETPWERCQANQCDCGRKKKVVYHSMPEAKRAIERLRSDPLEQELNAFRCPTCDHIHIGHYDPYWYLGR